MSENLTIFLPQGLTITIPRDVYDRIKASGRSLGSLRVNTTRGHYYQPIVKWIDAAGTYKRQNLHTYMLDFDHHTQRLTFKDGNKLNYAWDNMVVEDKR